MFLGETVKGKIVDFVTCMGSSPDKLLFLQKKGTGTMTTEYVASHILY
jgi:hypothetical protein